MMRPDEMANQAAIERDQRFRKNVKGGALTALGAGASVALSPLAARVAPFLSEYVPVDLAMKGLSKVSPQVANFLKKGQEAGLDIKEGMDFIKSKLNPKQEPAKDNRNLIEQYSPELHQFIMEQIQSGQSPLAAGALAQLEKSGRKSFRPIIEKIMKDHKADWGDIIESIYGASNAQKENAPQQSPAQGPQAAAPNQAQAGQGQNSAAQDQFLQELKGLLNS